MLTPMLVQYLVGLCCLRRHPDAVDITLGDMVLDSVARKTRDVDVTVTVEESPGITRAFKAYEVKRESNPLDITVVEQLCMKLLDMQSVTHRAIVSASGFTESARVKAARHRVELYEMQAWSGNLEDTFPNWEMTGRVDEVIKFGGWSLLYWRDWKVYFVALGGPRFSIEDTDLIYTSSGEPHSKFKSLAELKEALTLRSTSELCLLEPAQTVLWTFPMRWLERRTLVTPSWPHTHTLDLTEEAAYVKVGDRLIKLDSATISGRLQWETKADRPEYYIMRRVTDGEAYAGAIVALGPEEGQMLGFVLSPSSQTAGVHRIQLNEKQLNLIRELKIGIPNEEAS